MVKNLPNGSTLLAKTHDSDRYPAIEIYVQEPGGCSNLVCIAEYDPDQPLGQELSVGAYTRDCDEPAYRASYDRPMQT